ncbi:hypothetical protein [Celeribacter neptunius]|uniref:hypothetical protein n=1 Tax=Celeribacter neptunius TaxID=588602 RepID=UPI003CCBA546
MFRVIARLDGTLATGAFQDGLDPRDHLARAKRFGDIVIHAELETENAVDLVIAGREKQNWGI